MADQKLNITEKPDLDKARSRVRQEIPVVRDEIVVPERLIQYAQGKKYFIRTYGCQANVRDEENMRGLLELTGFTSVDDEKLADFVIINTCAIRENAEDKVFGELGILKGLKAIKPEMLIAVSGCMVQQTHIVDTITQKYRHVDLMFGTHNIHHLLELLDEAITKKVRVVNVPSKYGEIVENMPSKRNHRFKAFVNIMFGCDKFCTYCIVPYTRGKERSRLMDDVIKECKELVEQGYQEITLVGQNVNSYGKDFKNGTTFAQLLEAVALTGIPRLRFMTSHPWDFTDEMLDMIAKYDNIMNHIHLPFQAGDDMILRLMARRYTVASYLDLVKKMQTKIPHDERHYIELMENADGNKWEGLILRDSNSVYEGKRSKSMLKCKSFYDAEYKVIDLEIGPFRMIENGLEVTKEVLSNVVIEHKGNRVSVGSGFSIEEREYFKTNPNEILNKIITVKYFEETKNQSGLYSLRFPTVKYIHGKSREC